MTDNELLLAISDIVQSQTQPIIQNVRDTRALLENLTEEHRDTRTLLENLTEEHHDTRALLENLTEEHHDTRALLENLTEEHRDTRALLENEISQNRSTRLLLENEIIPRLQNIEACYTTTYQRYADGIQQLDTLQSDVDIIKKVVAEHSEILKKIS